MSMFAMWTCPDCKALNYQRGPCGNGRCPSNARTETAGTGPPPPRQALKRMGDLKEMHEETPPPAGKGGAK